MSFNHVEETGAADQPAIRKVENREGDASARLLFGKCLIKPKIESLAASDFNGVPPDTCVIRGLSQRFAMGGIKRFKLNPTTGQNFGLERHGRMPSIRT